MLSNEETLVKTEHGLSFLKLSSPQAFLAGI